MTEVRRQQQRRSLRARRRGRKREFVAALGGVCVDCGYEGCLEAFDLHHRDPSEKEFSIGDFSGAYARALLELAKCDLVCANCHRIRHLLEDASAKGGPVFEFHHRESSEKSFGITQDGIPRRWEKILAELAKCVMLCANCHREVHAGVRKIDEGPLGLAERPGAYALAS